MIEVIKYVLCTAAGVAIGYYVAQGRLERDFRERSDREIDEARDFYRRKYEKRAAEEGEPEELTQAAIDAAEALREYKGISVGPSVLSEEMTRTVEKAVERGELDIEEPADPVMEEYSEADVRIAEKQAEKAKEELSDTGFEDPLPKVDADVRVRGLTEAVAKQPVNYNRISTPPKAEEPKEETPKAETPDELEVRVDVITQKAFIDNQFGYNQFSFTYFAGDDVLANEEDEPVTGEAREAGVGTETLRKLKVGREAMGGEDVIYVRNHTGKWEFEITRSAGKFSDEVGAESG